MKNILFLVGVFASLIFSTHLCALTVPSPLVDTNWLNSNIDKVVILDVRKDTKSFKKSPIFKKNKKTGKQKLVRVGGHISGARLVNYKKVRGKQLIKGKKVSKMLPGKKAFEKLMQNAGVNKNDTVIIATKGESSSDITIATRFYWQMKYYGHNNMAILDGGVAAWIAKGRPLKFKTQKIIKGNWVSSTENKNILATSEHVINALKNNTQIIDARSISLYLGTWKKSYVYKKGHIPGAKFYPTEILTAPKAPAKFLSTKALKVLNQTMGVDVEVPSITYCNSGHLATGSWFVMSELMGNKKVRMYDGSMHQWTLENGPVTSMKME